MEETPLTEIRCPRCNTLWFKAQGKELKIEVKCHKCHEKFIFAGLWLGFPVFVDPAFRPDKIIIIR